LAWSDVFATGAFDAATAVDAPAVGEEDDFELHGWRVPFAMSAEWSVGSCKY